MWVLENALGWLSLGAPGYVTKMLQAEMGKNLTRLDRYISIIIDIDEIWFVIFEHIINQLSFGYVR